MAKRQRMNGTSPFRGEGKPAPLLDDLSNALTGQTVVVQEQFNIITRDATQRLEIEGCIATGAGLQVPDDLSQESMENLANILFHLQGRLQLFIGDMLVASERLGYGGIKAIAEQMDREGKTLSNWKSVCKAVTTSLRGEVHAQYPNAKPLSMTHYKLIQGMDTNAQTHWMSQALQHGYSVSQLRDAIHGESPKQLEPPIPAISKRIQALENTVTKKRWQSLKPHQRQQERDRLQSLLDKIDQWEQG